MVNDHWFETVAGHLREAYLRYAFTRNTSQEVDVVIRVHGGGTTGQSGACRLGIARALAKFDPELEAGLREANLMTRDGRMKERKKPGLRGARKSTQFSKR